MNSGEAPVLVAAGLGWPEGPTVRPDGNVVFVESYRSQLMVAEASGGGSGIGLEIAHTLTNLGADVAELDWTPGAATAAAETSTISGSRRSKAIRGSRNTWSESWR